MSGWEIVVGLEVHAQLSTRSKIFSSAATAYGAAPNAQACAVDIALPGVLPVLNREAVEKAIKFGLAVGATIANRSIFARKNYFYPDLPKGYQISQFELPVVQGGSIRIAVDGNEKLINLTRAHLEEDAGKSLHEDFQGMTGIDLNRAGTPLLEIVSEPEMRSSAEAVAYAKALHSLVRYLDICDGNMQEGSLRCDANVSVRREGSSKLGTRCEIKNLNSFRFLERAIDYEAARQIEILEEGGAIQQQTRLYDSDKDETRSMRSKEEAQDYRYFPDPDLLPLEISAVWIEKVRNALPELPQAKRDRYIKEYNLSVYDANLLTSSRDVASYFEQCISGSVSAAVTKQCANWINVELAARLNKEGRDVAQSPVTPAQLRGLVARIEDGSISSKMAKEVFEAMWNKEGDVDHIIASKGLKQISDGGEIEKIVEQILKDNPKQVEEFRSGKDKVFAFFIGQAMKAMHGKANPTQLNEILRKKLSNS